MATITIPKEVAKQGDLVIIPLKEYEELLLEKRKVKSFKPTAAEKKALIRGRKNLAERNYITLKDLERELGIKSWWFR